MMSMMENILSMESYLKKWNEEAGKDNASCVPAFFYFQYTSTYWETGMSHGHTKHLNDFKRCIETATKALTSPGICRPEGVFPLYISNCTYKDEVA